jgi:hypothetical protein
MRLMLGDNTPGVGGFLFVQPSPASGIQLCDCRSTNWICQPVWELCWWWQWLKVPEFAANGGSSDQSKDHPGCLRWQQYYYHCGLGHFPVCWVSGLSLRYSQRIWEPLISFKVGFLSSGTVDIVGQITFCCVSQEGCPEWYRIFSSIPGLCLLSASSSFPVMTTKNISRCC